MHKLVILEFEGDFHTLGFRITLEIRPEHQLQSLKVKGLLPPAPNVVHQLQHHWHQAYRSLGNPQRIKGQKIVHKGSVNQRIAKCQESAQELKHCFVRWLNAESFQGIDRRLREELNRDDTIRVLICTDEPNLQRLPWHEWDFFERYPRAEVALSTSEIDVFPVKPPPSSSSQIRILAILGHSAGINLDTDRRSLEQLPDADVEFLVEPDRQQLSDRLWEREWDILFFAGHSETEGETGRIYLNQTDSLTISELKYGLRKAIAHGLQLAIFNSCDGLGLARELKQLHIPQMIVMREPVIDRVAAVFLKYFLEAFASGQSLYLAERQARERLQGLEHLFPCASWLPVIYQNAADPPPDWFALRGQPDTNAVESAPMSVEAIAHPPSPKPEPISADDSTSSHLLRKKSTRPFARVLGTGLAIAFLVMVLRLLGLLQPFELLAYDHLLRMRPTETIDQRILVVEVTDNDVNQQGGYPLTDAALVEAIDALQPLNPRAIALDMHRYQSRGNGREDLIAQFQQDPNLFIVCGFDQAGRDYAPPPEFSKSQMIQQVGFSNFPDDRPTPAARASHRTDLLRENAALKMPMVRRHLLSYDPQLAAAPSPCSTPYSLSLQLAYRYLYQTNVQPLTVTDQVWQLGSVRFPPLTSRFGGYQHLDYQGSQVMLRYRAAQPGQHISLQQLLNGEISADRVKDRVVLIGYTAPVARDTVDTPCGKMAGVWVHAHMVSQILSAVLDHRHVIWTLPQWRWLQWGDGVWISSWAILGGWIIYAVRSRSFWGLMSAVVLTISTLYVSCLVVLNQGGWLPLVPPALSLLLAGLWIVYQLRWRSPLSKSFKP